MGNDIIPQTQGSVLMAVRRRPSLEREKRQSRPVWHCLGSCSLSVQLAGLITKAPGQQPPLFPKCRQCAAPELLAGISSRNISGQS